MNDYFELEDLLETCEINTKINEIIEESTDIILVFDEISEEILNEFNVYVKNNPKKEPVVVMIRSSQAAARNPQNVKSNKPAKGKHNISIKVKDPDVKNPSDGDFVPVSLERNNKKLQIPDDIKGKNQRASEVIVDKNVVKAVNKLLDEHEDDIRRYWELDPNSDESKEIKERLEKKYPNPAKGKAR